MSFDPTMPAGLGEVIAERRAQMQQHGHDTAADAELPLDALPAKAAAYLTIGRDCLRGQLCERDLPRARRKLIQAGALILAALDRLEAAA